MHAKRSSRRMTGENRLIHFAEKSSNSPDPSDVFVPEVLSDVIRETPGGDVEVRGDSMDRKEKNLQTEIADEVMRFSRPEERYRELLSIAEGLVSDQKSREVLLNLMSKPAPDSFESFSKTSDTAKFPKEQILKNPNLNKVNLAVGMLTGGVKGVFVLPNVFATAANAAQRIFTVDEDGGLDPSGVTLRTPEGPISLDNAKILDRSSNVLFIKLPEGTRLYNRYAKLGDNPNQNEMLARMQGRTRADIVQVKPMSGINGRISPVKSGGFSGASFKGGEPLGTFDGRVAGIQAGPRSGGGNNFSSTANFIPAAEIRRAMKANGISESALGSLV